MPLTNPHDKQDRIRKMRDVRSLLLRHLPGFFGEERRRIHAYADDVLEYLEDERVHYGCPLDDPCGFGEDAPGDIGPGDTVELIHDVWSLRKGQRFRAKIYACSTGRWYCESLNGVASEGWLDPADMVKVDDVVPSPPQDYAI